MQCKKSTGSNCYSKQEIHSGGISESEGGDDIGEEDAMMVMLVSKPKGSGDESEGEVDNKVDNNQESSGSEDASTLLIRAKKRITRFSDSDSDSDHHNHDEMVTMSKVGSDNSNQSPIKCGPVKSRLRKVSSSDENTDPETIAEKTEQESRIQNKRCKLKQKFKSLLTSRCQEIKASADNDSEENRYNSDKDGHNTDNSEEELATSISKMKEKIKERTMTLKSSLYDPDTSDEERSEPKKLVQKRGKKTKPTSPKPIRMSAKQAMENMQKIKSESNRMLREKEVSLPYHRPKALSLKDIMSRRRPAVAADGKALPIKMNEEQLKQYVQQLEQRQKEVIELCKSESEEEENNEAENTDNVALQNDTLFDDMSKTALESSVVEDPDSFDVNNLTEKNEHENVKCQNTLHSDNLIENNVDNINDEQAKPESEPISLKETLADADPEFSVNQSVNESPKEHVTGANSSTEMDLVYNDSVEDNDDIATDKTVEDNLGSKTVAENNTEVDSQLISLHYDTEKTDNNSEKTNDLEDNNHDLMNVKNTVATITCTVTLPDNHEKDTNQNQEEIKNVFSDDDNDINMEDIDALIEKAEIIASETNIGSVNSPMLVKDALIKTNPKLTGAPGMVIDLDGTDPLFPKKMSGMELLKERFVYFAKLKTPEEMAREREKKVKPGTQHLRLKQELEEQIAEQRSLEWAKRLEEDKQQQKEMDAVMGDVSDAEEDIDKIEAKLEEKEEVLGEDSSESEEEEESEGEIIEKPRKRNPMVDDEAVESDNEAAEDQGYQVEEENDIDDGNVADEEDDGESEDSEESSEESEESENEERKPRKGRILKAFEDSDEEDNVKSIDNIVKSIDNIEASKTDEADTITNSNSEVEKYSQDDEIQLAQIPKTLSEDIFTSQESHSKGKDKPNNSAEGIDDKELGTQTFSILEPCSAKNNMDVDLLDKITSECDTQSHDDNLDEALKLCSGRFTQTQNLITPTQTQSAITSQNIGDDVLALCTGKFYNNQFISQTNSQCEVISQDNNVADKEVPLTALIEKEIIDPLLESNEKQDTIDPKGQFSIDSNKEDTKVNEKSTEDTNLKSILDELNDPEFDAPKTYKYFTGNESQNKENKSEVANAPLKKKFVIDSDDEDNAKVDSERKLKKIKRKKLEKRALQISDDEESEQELELESEEEDGEGDKMVEYDDEENEIVLRQENPKKKRKTTEFFENEAELTSEDEWIGSGDEDERGLDRMEREEGDDETFNQNQLQRELGQIHMRDVLDQDKREVRLIQELLFEDGDLGGGHRQRKFRWRDVDGEDGTGIPYNDCTDTQEEEFESEEQWRKQRHEREMFLKSMQKDQETESALNTSMSRSSIIKANLSKNSTSLLMEINTSVEKQDAPITEKKTAKDIPSPKKPFTIFQQNYHGSLLTRGRGALARLAALATPLAYDDDGPKIGSLGPTSNRNFVFAAVEATETEQENKVTKRKADSNSSTPRLVKKMRTEDKNIKQYKSSLIDHIKL